MASEAPFLIFVCPKSIPELLVSAVNFINRGLSTVMVEGSIPASSMIDFPSGVSSDMELSTSDFVKCFSSIPGAAKKLVAFLLPIVMVPVLSSNNTSISPAVSTALPLLVITFALKALSIPAIPMALNKPPIVVGIRQTNRDTNAAMVIGVFEYSLKGRSVTQTNTNTRVKPASKIVKAISLGVFCLLAPSTKAIILSRKLSPGSVVTLTFILSLKTFVPPVTLDLSPPLSLITGALSPVMALSSIVAIPCIISPSIGMVSPASQRNISPFLRSEEGTIFISSK